MKMKGRLASGILAGVLAGAVAMAAAPSIASADATCGSKENPCPLQKWMRQNMATANSSGDMAALQAQFAKVASIAPDKSWNGSDAKASWDAIANAGAAAAKANDAAGVKQACKACHDGFKDKYKAQYRMKPAP
jgi:hypothetical protein